MATAGASTITVTFSGSVTSVYTGLAAQEFSASSGASTVWATDTGAGISNASSTTVTFPRLTPTADGRALLRLRRRGQHRSGRDHGRLHLQPDVRRRHRRLQPGCLGGHAAHRRPEPGWRIRWGRHPGHGLVADAHRPPSPP